MGVFTYSPVTSSNFMYPRDTIWAMILFASSPTPTLVMLTGRSFIRTKHVIKIIVKVTSIRLILLQMYLNIYIRITQALEPKASFLRKIGVGDGLSAVLPHGKQTEYV